MQYLKFQDTIIKVPTKVKQSMVINAMQDASGQSGLSIEELKPASQEQYIKYLEEEKRRLETKVRGLEQIIKYTDQKMQGQARN